MTLSTRKPTGLPAWPLILVEGEEKAGKSYLAAQFAASPLVGRTFAWDLGDGTLDEYAALGPYEIVETNGTFSDLRDSVREATAIPPVDGKPNVYVIDSGTDLWGLLKRWTDTRARQSRAGRNALAQDPDAEIDPSTNLWNDAKDRWAEIVNMLRRAPGIGVITAQGGEVMAFEGGVPVAGKTTWSVQAEKTISAACTAWVRVKRDPRSATLIGVRRLGLEIPDRGLPLPLDNTLHHLVFEIIGAGTQFGTTLAVPTQVGLSVAKAKTRVLGAVKANHPNLSDDEAKAEATRVWNGAGLGSLGATDEVTAEQLVAVLDVVVSDASEPPDAPKPPDGPVGAPEAPQAQDGPQGVESGPATAEDLTTEFHGDPAPEHPNAPAVLDPATNEAIADGLDALADRAVEDAELARVAHMQAQRDRIAAVGAVTPAPTETGIDPYPDLPILTTDEIAAMRKIPLISALTERGCATHGKVDALIARLTETEASRAALRGVAPDAV